MKNAFRQSMSWLHTWVGLLAGWVLFFMFLTGTAGYFDTEIDRWMKPERPLVHASMSLEQMIDVGLKRLQAVAPTADRWFISPPVSRENPDLRVTHRQAAADGKPARNGNELLNPQTGAPVQTRDTGGGQLLYRMHYDLHYLPNGAANWLVGVCSMFMLIAIVTGVIVHKRIFKDFFTFRPGKKQRSWLDAHNVLSVLALPFHLMITYSGLIFFMLLYMPVIVSANYGKGEDKEQLFLDAAVGRADVRVERAGVPAVLAPLGPMLAAAEQYFGDSQVRFLEILNPNDRNARVFVARQPPGPLRNTEQLMFDGVSGKLMQIKDPVANTTQAVRDVLLGLHEGLFAGPVLRWLYFLAGLMGTAMIGAGLVLWTTKRRAKGAEHFGLRLVERLNVGTIVGVPIGIATYFWANRLIPVEFAGRAAWEAHALFLAWGLMLVHAHWRPLSKTWIEQLWIAAGLYSLLPLLNALTTDRHLGVTLRLGEWSLAGFDLTMCAIGILFALTAKTARQESFSSATSESNPLRAPANSAPSI